MLVVSHRPAGVNPAVAAAEPSSVSLRPAKQIRKAGRVGERRAVGPALKDGAKRPAWRPSAKPAKAGCREL